MLEKNIEDYWNVDGDRELSDTWTGFTRFTVDRYSWSGGRLTRKQTTARHFVAKDLARYIEKPRLHNAGKLRGIYLIDPAGEN